MCFEFVVKCQVNGLPSTQTKQNVLTMCKASSPACAATGEIKAMKCEQLADLQQMPSQFVCDEETVEDQEGLMKILICYGNLSIKIVKTCVAANEKPSAIEDIFAASVGQWPSSKFTVEGPSSRLAGWCPLQLPKYKIMELNHFAEMMSKANSSVTGHPTSGHTKTIYGRVPHRLDSGFLCNVFHSTASLQPLAVDGFTLNYHGEFGLRFVENEAKTYLEVPVVDSESGIDVQCCLLS
ncbi:hypothetical protein DUI87_23291 [Hirundo rustica rustica]|uniref:Uncharacterized protein n=1 Tax=Hirundo rustica rustica TaxID=333673 RepID=A0A3M0JIE1_HIRRU|nr:hypothetical protein DUI87_23291 [Hirundo rustica rustica]